eukprot:CAMPEP_0204102018 /NCGR_PEP_ID=MMETSP0360-20130528/194771_1 /ASSEMBLY_ACC=CAM_ASM_000342 /TAXON_ID=268821 /ORGANISM="Scrippsiella Hangoei, Strain SHTV-5" /LENGTH=256 /DNA_ID=CAMNT_0051051433 /DNA_START=1 /DNA_END=772 /DNA_ORIENTATION=-
MARVPSSVAACRGGRRCCHAGVAGIMMAALVFVGYVAAQGFVAGARSAAATAPAPALRARRVQRRFSSVKCKEAAEMLEGGLYAYLDVRTEEEWQDSGVADVPELAMVTSHVPGPRGMAFDTQAWLEKVQRIFPDKQSKIVVGCKAAVLEGGLYAYLDVRTEEEWQDSGVADVPELAMVTSHVPGPRGMAFDTQAWLEKVQRIFPDKQSKIVVGCKAGSRSKAAASVLEEAGYTELVELDDGFMGWKMSGLPVKYP